MGWTSVDGYKKLPVGSWVVRFDTDREHDKYGVMWVAEGGNGSIYATCGNAFAFDLPDVVAYADIPS